VRDSAGAERRGPLSELRGMRECVCSDLLGKAIATLEARAGRAGCIVRRPRVWYTRFMLKPFDDDVRAAGGYQCRRDADFHAARPVVLLLRSEPNGSKSASSFHDKWQTFSSSPSGGLSERGRRAGSAKAAERRRSGAPKGSLDTPEHRPTVKGRGKVTTSAPFTPSSHCHF